MESFGSKRWTNIVGHAACVCLVFVMSVRAQSFDDVYTTPQDYSIEQKAGSLQGLFCDLPDNDNPYPQCEQNAWLSVSGALGMNQDMCGQCLQITNTAPGGGSVTACILDLKQSPGFDLDLSNGFNVIDDSNEDGQFNGHMVTNAVWVDC